MQDEKSYTLFKNIDGEDPLIAMIDMGKKDVEEKNTFPWQLQVHYKISNPDENGFPNGEEAEKLNLMEDEILELLSTKVTMHFIGRITTGSWRTLLIYVSDHEVLSDILKKYVEKFDEGDIEIGFFHDPSWENVDQYFGKK